MSSRRTIVFLAGTPWDGIAGTDRHLATQLACDRQVLWVDPPVSALGYLKSLRHGGSARPGLSKVDTSIRRLRVIAVPGVTRPGVRNLVAVCLDLIIRLVTVLARMDIDATILATPEGRFPRLRGVRLLFVTDDWVAGAAMLGVNSKRVDSLLTSNLRQADAALAVSTGLVDMLRARAPGQDVMLLPNGCSPLPVGGSLGVAESLPDGPFAVLVGQLNERIDPAILVAIADSGTNVVVIGPRTERDPGAVAAFDAAFRHPRVSWLGARDPAELPAYLTSASVGITPYTDTAFNRSSFPLKTLEYLAAGLPVVSTDLPAVTWLDTDLIAVGSDPATFADQVRRAVCRPREQGDVQRRHDFAASHSWRSRSRTVLKVVDRKLDRHASGPDIPR